MVASGLPSLAIAVGAVVVVVCLLAVIVFKSMWRVAEPNEALIISGFRSRRDPSAEAESMGFKMVTGHGTLVIPGVQVVRKLSLDLNEADLAVDCVTKQGIPVHLKAVVIYKIGDDFASIANAARRFLDQQNMMDARIQNVFSGHLRAICGSLTVEELIRERDKLTEATRAAAGTEMQKLGLGVARSLLANTAARDRPASKNGVVPTERTTAPDGDLHRRDAGNAGRSEYGARASVSAATRGARRAAPSERCGARGGAPPRGRRFVARARDGRRRARLRPARTACRGDRRSSRAARRARGRFGPALGADFAVPHGARRTRSATREPRSALTRGRAAGRARRRARDRGARRGGRSRGARRIAVLAGPSARTGDRRCVLPRGRAGGTTRTAQGRHLAVAARTPRPSVVRRSRAAFGHARRPA